MAPDIVAFDEQKYPRLIVEITTHRQRWQIMNKFWALISRFPQAECWTFDYEENELFGYESESGIWLSSNEFKLHSKFLSRETISYFLKKNNYLCQNFKNQNFMFNQKIQDAINAQINAEMWSAYLYLSMSTYCYDQGYAGFGNWFKVQFKEEQDHALIYINYLISRGARVKLEPIQEVPTDWNSLLEVFQATLEHERKVTSLINSLYSLALKEEDFATQSMLKWFIDEQVEEEETAIDIINNLKMIKDNGYGLYMIDKELAGRTYAEAAPLAKNAE